MSANDKEKMVQQSFQSAPKPQSPTRVNEASQQSNRINNTYGQAKGKSTFIQGSHSSSGKKYSTLGLCVLVIAIIVFIAVASGLFGNKEPEPDTHSSPQSTAVPQGAWLTDLKPIDEDLWWIRINQKTDAYATDGSGYNHYLCTYQSNPATVTYALHEMYSSLSARWVLDATRANASADAGALQIYTDDSLAFSSSEISIRGQLYQDVYVDLTGCDYLKIEFVGYHYEDGMFGSYGNIGRLNNIWLEPYMGAYANNTSTKPADTNQNTNWSQPESVSIRQLPSVIECLDYSNYSITDQYGNEYRSYFDFCSYHESGYDAKSQYLILRPQGNWRYLRGKYFARPSQEEGFVICFQIFADDVLVYDSGMIDKYTSPVDFDIDIGYADTIRMQSYSENYTFWGTNPGVILVNTEVHN